MRTLEEYLRLRLGRRAARGFRRELTTVPGAGRVPTAFRPEATALAQRVARKIGGLPMSLVTETVMGIPTTPHLLGGCGMGENPEAGVIDARHRVFGYDGLYVVDGSAVSANPGVNPALTICALAERAMSLIPPAGCAASQAGRVVNAGRR
ncbi:MAG: GMC family oxidoreductase [Candidatus Rokubacteria bacterium]|nr:GMC family oxidoreductase [Candidatus Rokubacteria bacterium]